MLNINEKKTAKQLIKLACSIGVASKTDLYVLHAMIRIKLQDATSDDLNEMFKLEMAIRNNSHLLALMKVKSKD